MRLAQLLGPLLVVACVWLPAASAASDTSFGVVDLQGAMWQTEEGLRAQTQLKKLVDKHQQEVDAKKAALSRTRAEIQRQEHFLSRDAVNRRVELWQEDMRELQTVFLDYNKELDKKQEELTAPILKRLIALVAKVARDKGYDVVIDKRAAPYSKGELDITDRVVQMYNAGESG